MFFAHHFESGESPGDEVASDYQVFLYLCYKNPGTGRNVKSFAIGAFLEHIFVEIANEDLY